MKKYRKYVRVSVNINGKVLVFEGWDKEFKDQVEKQMENEFLEYNVKGKENFPRYIVPKYVMTMANVGIRKKHRSCKVPLDIYGKGLDVEINSDLMDIEEIEIEEKSNVRPIKKVLRPIDEFNGMTPQSALEYIKSQIDIFDCDDERLNDAIKRLDLLIIEAK